jgi:hypothetical protein
VQFHPYVGTYTPQWRLAWDGSERGSVEIDRPDSGPPATVLLADPSAPGTRSVRMRLFAENLFPATVAATDGLHAVVLDHQPRWEGPRRQAFLDWVTRGGVVHLLPGPGGALPHFTEELSALNVATDRANIGSGIVVKHAFASAEITEKSLQDAGFPGPQTANNSSGNIHDLDGFLFRKLASVTRPRISWGAIYLLTIVYVVLIGPVFYLLRRRDYRLLLGGLLVTIAAFAWIFTVVGRRGYGEKQIYHSLAIARSLGKGRFDVHEWIHAFATSGDVYRFEHAGGGHLYAALGEGEATRGVVHEGRESYFDADIPLFSSRPFLHRGVIAAGGGGFAVTKWETMPAAGGERLKAISVSADPATVGTTISAVLEHQGRYFDLARTERGFEMKPGAIGMTSSEFFGQENFYDSGAGWYGSDFGDAEAIMSRLRSLHRVFISHANGDKAYFRNYITRPRPSDGRARLMVYAEAPPAFGLKSDRFQAGRQFVLYVQDIFKP